MLLKIILKQLLKYSISSDNIRDEYTFVFSDVGSLITNAQLKKTIEMILSRVYSEKKISTINNKCIGNKGKYLLKQCITEVKHNCTFYIKFEFCYIITKKTLFYCLVKNKIPIAQQCRVPCPVCLQC